jgi:tetratricopeptide (TPR) repeat protein
MLLDSAQRRFRGGRSTEARQLLRQAKNFRSMAEVELDESQAQTLRRQLFVLEGQLLEHSGELTGAAHAWEHALSAAEMEGDFNAVAQSRAGLGLVYAARGEAAMAADGLAQAVAQLPQGDPLWPRVAQALATARLEMGRADEAEELWSRLEDMGRATHASTVVAEAVLGKGMVAILRGELDVGRTSLEDAELRLRDQMRPLQLTQVLLTLSELGLAQGRLLESTERALEAERMAREIPRVVLCIHALGVAAQARAALGRGADALTMAREASTLARARGRVNTVPELMAAATVARALCAAGMPGEGLVLVPPPSGRTVPVIQDPVRVVWAVRARALSLSEPQKSVEAVKEAIARSPSRLPAIAVREQMDIAVAMVQVGMSSAEEETRRAVDMAVKTGLSMFELEALELLGRINIDPRLATRLEVLRTRLAGSMGDPESFIRRWT